MKENKKVARILCDGDISIIRQKGYYDGIKTCSASFLVTGGTILCDYGCLGFGDCIKECPAGAIKKRENLSPEIDEEKCNACGLCIESCPKNLIKIISKDKRFLVACASNDKEKIVKQVCSVGCTGCGICVSNCTYKAITVEDNLAKIDYDKCQNSGECYRECPTKCIQWKR
ncbi:MAG: hypothetical protein A2539_02580 [Elusimicrobia bacterium RIFOXYD2_FULL_34_15]|nr:MAG: hypothetical protein A2539_02580 [Elusimicrobia bacterium RIFOXYD2_FULL_34_15]